MSNKAAYSLLICLMCILCLSLCACGVDTSDSILNTPANYEIDISLPYATNPPDENADAEVAALVIDSEGVVTVNDSASILNDSNSDDKLDESNYKTLSQGNTGLAVQALQTRLQELGYFSDGVSGIFDENTEMAVRRFEQAYGTMQTGVATAKLQARLFAADAPVYGSDEYTEAVVSQYVVLERGDVGSSVYALQQRLKNLGYPISELTGVYDNATANAVMLFYEAYGLTADDVANVALQKELYSDSARAYSKDANASVQQAYTTETLGKIQQLLTALGYYSGEIHGSYDRATEIAIKLFESACGQTPTGILSEDMLRVLQSSKAPAFASYASQYVNLLEGSSGTAVTQLQSRLVALGFATGTPNGEYAASTTASVKLFQSANGLEATGVASTYVQAVLYSSFAYNIDGEPASQSTISALSSGNTADVLGDDSGITFNTLAPGASGEDVTRLQQRLDELGFANSLSGSYDELTSRAVSNFQLAVGLTPSSAIDNNLQLFLYSNAAPENGTVFHEPTVSNVRDLTLGDSGDDVTALQKRLWQLNYLETDDIQDSVGTYNAATAQAVQQVQQELEYLNANGVASAALQCYLHSDFSDSIERED